MSLARCLAVAACLAAMPVKSAFADVKAGEQAWTNGNYLTAIAEWRPLAEKGDAAAQFNLAEAYRLGRGVGADRGKARSWYEKAAQQGHEEAQANLGLILFQDGDRDGGMGWIRKSAASGNARARYVLATALFNGDAEAIDRPRAYALMSRAASQGLTAAASSLIAMENVMPESERQLGMKLARDLTRADAERAGGHKAARAAVESPRTTRLQPTARASEVSDKRPASLPPATAEPAAKAPSPALALSRPAAGAAQKAAGGGRWRVQFGAYESVELAKGEWMRLAKKMDALAGLQPSFEPAGPLTRLRVNALADRAAAQKLCNMAKAIRQACFAIAP